MKGNQGIIFIPAIMDNLKGVMNYYQIFYCFVDGNIKLLILPNGNNLHPRLRQGDRIPDAKEFTEFRSIADVNLPGRYHYAYSL